ncbi:MAG: hypothetical protein ACLT98_07350 [Eggerthellaceae bacterium]
MQGAATPVQSYGLGWIFVHLGDLLGVVTLVLVESGMAAGAFSLDQVAAVSIALLVGFTMFVLSDGRAFAFGARNEDGVLHDAASKRSTAARADAGGANADEAASAPALAADIDELTARILELAERGGLTPRETEVFDLLARGRSIPYARRPSSSRARRPPPTPSTSTPNSTCTPAKSSSTSCISSHVALPS